MQRVHKYLKQKNKYFIINSHFQIIKDRFMILNSFKIKDKMANNWKNSR